MASVEHSSYLSEDFAFLSFCLQRLVFSVRPEAPVYVNRAGVFVGFPLETISCTEYCFDGQDFDGYSFDSLAFYNSKRIIPRLKNE